MSENTYMFYMILVMATVTAFLRFAPFLVFRRKTPKGILYLGNVLPEAVMAMLIVYCLRNISVFQRPYGIPEALAMAIVVIFHRWKHNTLLSILLGTICYMVLVQLVFITV